MDWTIKIFIVDDEISILDINNKLFEINGFDVIATATNGEEAVNKYQKFIIKPDLIIMDYHMPYKNGIEATKAILEIDRMVKIVIISGDISVKEKALASGAIYFREKPFNISKIIQEINICINKKKIHVECKFRNKAFSFLFSNWKL